MEDIFDEQNNQNLVPQVLGCMPISITSLNCLSCHILFHTYHSTGVCVDIDECNEPDLNDCPTNGFCVNDIPGYHCECNTGIFEFKRYLIDSILKNNKIEKDSGFN